MIVGPDEQLRLLKDRILRISEQAVEQATIAALPVIKEEVQIAFEEQMAPSSRPWKELKDPKKRNRPILSGLKEYFSIGIIDNFKIFVTNSKWYAKFHQSGTRKMVDRRFLPVKGEIVPAWEKKIAIAIKEKIHLLLGKT